MQQKYSVLFISRAFPPTIGGIENQNYDICTHLQEYTQLRTIINKYGKKFLPLFIPWALVKSLWYARKTNIILLGDGVLSILPFLLKKITPSTQCVCIIHGLDITWPHKLYQKLWLQSFFHSVNHFIAVSNNTKQLLIEKGIHQDKITVIPNGFNFDKVKIYENAQKFQQLTRCKNSQVILITVGRMVKRKGVAWFIDQVIPYLDFPFLYILAGDGIEKENILHTIARHKLQKQVLYLGRVSQSEKELLLSNSDIFIQPNIKIQGDVEGFGISVIEANAYGLPVLAAKLEGLTDAIIDNKNGYQVTSESAEEYLTKLSWLASHPQQLQAISQQAKLFSQKHFNWKQIIKQYLQTFERL